MSQQYETGHAKNVANLQKLIEQISVYPNYNPSIDNLKIEAVNTLYTQALESLNNLVIKKGANKEAIYVRQKLFTDLKSTATRVINQLDILGLNEGTFKEAKSFNKLIQGSKNKTPKEEEGQNGDEEKETYSTSRQSYTQLAENFSRLLQLTSTIESYNPNLDEIKLVNLTAYHTSLVDATQTVNQTEAELNTVYTNRNTILYDESTGLYEISQNVKKYVKSVYGASSPEFKNVSKIRFTNKEV